ncbi:major facilitator superfamily transporter [Colletotrichum fioriniae PJ7]|uniref:Major facilitator superfamily transporter n=1 Tax=Colletotrichum fioriniae PJ7 TaxID=1445577 RepID=A0A010RCI6_9PEZI|nr:major facilitator superfamily transporter [Colletotrichum fioriniae PJ7]
MEADTRDTLDISIPPPLNGDSQTSNTHENVVNNDFKEKTENPQEKPGSQRNDVNEMTTGEDSDESQIHQYATPRELALLSTVFTIATFMIAIDGSILATAIPKITSDFHRLNDVPWYGSAYLFTEMAFQPTFGRLYTLFNARILYLTSVIIFEAGSILCAASPNSAALITGRVISGIGAAGLLCGSLSVYGRSVPLRARPFGMALVTSMYGVAGVLGPTLGGLITDTPRLTWRFCFCCLYHELTGQPHETRATIPMRILSQRTVAISCTFNMLMSMAHNTHMYYLAFYFQAVLGTNAVTSGVRCLAYGIPCSIAIIITGACVSSKGYYVPFMWLGSSVFIAGCVLLQRLDRESSMGQWIGFQVLSGAGIGLAEQVPFIAVQVVLPDSDMPTACAMVVFHRLLGGAVGLSIASNLFSQELYRRLAEAPGGVNVKAIQDAGASDLAKAVPAAVLPFVQKAFSFAISRAFILPIVVAGTSLLLSFGMQRRWIPDDRVQPGQEANTGDPVAPVPLNQGRNEKTV